MSEGERGKRAGWAIGVLLSGRAQLNKIKNKQRERKRESRESWQRKCLLDVNTVH
jgi:hypothetical protein